MSIRLSLTSFVLRGNIPLLAAAALALAAGGSAHAEDWAPLTGAGTLRAFVSDVTVRIEVSPGEFATGQYRADGTASITYWGETFERTWAVRGEDQVCYSSLTETSCFTIEQDRDHAGTYRARNTVSGETQVFHVQGKAPGYVITEEPADSAGGLGVPSAADVAAELSNPNAAMGTLNTLFDYVAYDGDLPGAGSQHAFRAIFQPSLPYPLSPTTNLFVRPAIPVIFSQDVPDATGRFRSEGIDLGDISMDAFLGRTFAGGIVLGAGVVATVPTATSDALGLDQWLLGPEVLVAKVGKWGAVGLLLTQQWDIAGEDDYDTNVTGGQYFYAINLSDGWQIVGSPTFAYNHEASDGNQWTVPVAVGISKTAILNGRPWKFGLQFWYYIQSPDVFGPQYQMRFGISPVVALPWGK